MLLVLARDVIAVVCKVDKTSKLQVAGIQVGSFFYDLKVKSTIVETVSRPY